MKITSKVLVIGLVVIVFVGIVVAGYTGVVKVPLVTPSPQLAYNSYEVTDLAISYYNMIQQIMGDSIGLPELGVIDSYGLEYHLYGTDDSASSVESYYDSILSSWTQRYKDSGFNWAVGIYQHIFYGFGYAVGQDSRLKQLIGYNTVYLTIEGPASAWEQLINDMES